MDNKGVYLGKMIQMGVPQRKILTLANSSENELRKCLCTQLVVQGDCKLKEIVEQVRRNEL